MQCFNSAAVSVEMSVHNLLKTKYLEKYTTVYKTVLKLLCGNPTHSFVLLALYKKYIQTQTVSFVEKKKNSFTDASPTQKK